MKIIPVIDLKDGVIVQAREGRREQYLPLKTNLCNSSDIFQIVQVFWTSYHFDTVYIADLNAITQQGNHDRLINDLMAYFPDLMFWLDRGYPHHEIELKHPSNYLSVLGSESLEDNDILKLKAYSERFILSLDYDCSETLGPTSLFSSPEYWPDNIIIMTLDRVGSQKGPDIDKLSAFRNLYPDKNFIAAGGIRNQRDLLDLEKLGIQSALIASALHTGAIDADEIAQFQAKKYPD